MKFIEFQLGVFLFCAIFSGGGATAMAQSGLVVPDVKFEAVAVKPKSRLARKCGPSELSDPDVRVLPYIEPVEIDHTQKSSDLRKIAGRTKGGVNRFPVKVGLTTTNFVYRTELSMENLTYASGQSCVGIEKLHLHVQSRDNIIYIERSIPQGSCLYREVLAHEQKHVDVNEHIQRLAQVEMRKVIQELSQKYNGKLYNSAQEGYREIETAVNQQLKVLWAKLNDDWSKRQNAIDSNQEYERLSKVCNNGISYLYRSGALR